MVNTLKLPKIFRSEFGSYIVIGLLMTLGSFILWNIFIKIGQDNISTPFAIIFSASQFLAAFIFIFPSFYLNRKITFAKHSRKSGRIETFLKAYSIYLISPAVASIITYLLQLSYNFESVNFKIDLFLVQNLSFNFGRYFLQFLGLLISTLGNYFGQKIILYHPNSDKN